MPVVGYGLVSLGLAALVVRRPLNLTSERSLRATYVTQLFIGIGVAESPAILGATGSFLYGGLRTYALGMGFALLDFLHIAPGPRNLAGGRSRSARPTRRSR